MSPGSHPCLSRQVASPLQSPDAAATFIATQRARQTAALEWFAHAKLHLAPRLPSPPYPGMFAEVDSLSGLVRPPRQQKLWTWGDCRALGMWSYLLVKGVIPNAPFHQDAPSLRTFFENYCDELHAHLLDRLNRNQGRLPFLAEPATQLASNDPRNHPTAPGSYEPTHVFAASAFLQYGLLRQNQDSLRLGQRFLAECLACGLAFRGINHLTGQPHPQRGHGFAMITLGAIVDTLKTLTCLPACYQPGHSTLRLQLITHGRTLASLLTQRFFNPETGVCWEYNDHHDSPYIDAHHVLLCDPGHSAEALGFMAELEALAPSTPASVSWMPRAVAFINRHAYSDTGLMFKNLDALSGRGLSDQRLPDGHPVRTAPWWNLRECSAASLRLYVLTGEEICLQSFTRAHRTSMQHYPSPWCPAILLQTLDADTAAPLPLHPATGNIDPLHDARATERELDALIELHPTLRSSAQPSFL